eukprot:TRINITY_DN1005_c0_g1_i1.p1 TRINITY_DN1005_c0_g1~~TRINITY_DN1005_c0_g1_i1.p1  ORF type:complete len:443 (-),score=98.20 TRINITY_DN1005_c0_g1_i1:359-1534(-)
MEHSSQDEPKFDEENENKFVQKIFEPTKPTENWEKKYKQEQKKIKRQDREKVNYESESTSEDAKVEKFGDNDIKVKEEAKYCQWSPHNNLLHILYGKKGVIDISATFRGIRFDLLVEEYIVRVVLIRANIQHRQYPVECVCLQHKGQSEEDTHQVLQAKPGTSPDKFWYTYDGLRKSIIFEAPRPDASGNINVHMNLVSLCCDSCEAASPKYQSLINTAGKEAGRDWLLVITLESRKNERQTVLARDVRPCWFKAAVNPRDLKKLVRRKEKGGGAQKASRLKRIAENSAITESDGKRHAGQAELDNYILSPTPEGKKLLPKPTDLPVRHTLLPRLSPDQVLLPGLSVNQEVFQLSLPVVTMDRKFHVSFLRKQLANGEVTRDQLMYELGLD